MPNFTEKKDPHSCDDTYSPESVLEHQKDVLLVVVACVKGGRVLILKEPNSHGFIHPTMSVAEIREGMELGYDSPGCLTAYAKHVLTSNKLPTDDFSVEEKAVTVAKAGGGEHYNVHFVLSKCLPSKALLLDASWRTGYVGDAVAIAGTKSAHDVMGFSAVETLCIAQTYWTKDEGAGY